MKKIKKIYNVFLIQMIIIISFQVSCKRSLMQNESEHNDTVIINSELNIDSETENLLFPENGQSGGIGSAGVGNGLRARVYKYGPYSWRVRARVVNFNSRRGIVGASVYLHSRIAGNKFEGVKLKAASYKGSYYYNGNLSLKPGNKCGYFHVIHEEKNIDFKIGFSMERLEINGMVINGVNKTAGDGKTITIDRNSGIRIQVNCPKAKYYIVKISGLGGTYSIYNYYAPTGQIIIPSSVTSKYLFYGRVSVHPHNVFLANGFTVPKYKNGSKQVSVVSVNYGEKVMIGTRVLFK